MNQLPKRVWHATATPVIRRTASKIAGSKAASSQLLQRRENSATATAEATAAATADAVCPHLGLEQEAAATPRIHATAEWQNALSYQEIPGPKPLPILGNTWRLMPIIGQYTISDVAKISSLLHDRYGRIVRFSGLIGRPDLLFIYDADEIEKCYRSEGPTPFRPSMPSLVKYKSVVRKDFFGELGGVVGVHGEPWRQFRSRVQKPVLQLSTIRRYLQPLEVITEDFLERCERLLDANEELPLDFDNEIHKWSLECIGRVALDARLGCLEDNLTPDSEPQQIIDAAKYALRNVATLELKAPYWRYFPTPLWTRYVKNMNFFVGVCMKYIQSATERLKTQDASLRNGEPSLLEKVIMSEKDEKIATIMALDLILVGIDTISMAVCSILYQLATRPAEQQKVHEELKRLLPDANTPLTIPLLDQMHHLKAFIKEVFRMYSTVIGNGRTLQEDSVICGYQVPKGVQAVFPTIVTGNMEEYVTDAATFRPERWLKPQHGGTPGKLHPFASLPYGYGARMCLGRRFADLEMQILLAKLLRNYKLEYNHPPLDYAVTFMYAPDGPLRFKMSRI
ncbi:probable cytochrome P450 301a1, mitochondrial [Drosophila sulfurigaster albostrigata]|uniref:Probable cytochrome P450 301a1, mitochondrial n=1 Tax=Drosophila albomicans TaxID=7291 RepID=A0A6P8X7R5_DROAB|nr:probable cytochrome P450 301a1, mitochondrial [Drosophila albomicans]XP_062132536.1 probable cytochrome P450 301a1, mitochondrial [Drosophila sulfurigaster albostrigata]